MLPLFPNQTAVLCYVDAPWAYFTTQSLERQWGDDWDDAPYEHNAGEPYIYRPGSVSSPEPYSIILLAYRAFNFTGLVTPAEGHTNSPYSVKEINAGVVPWLSNQHGLKYNPDTRLVEVWAGTLIPEFCRRVRLAGGGVWMPSA